MSKVKDGTYIHIEAFMVNELNLKGNDLLVYAIIHGFSQDGLSEFKGGLQYLADWCNSTKQGILKNLKSLIDKNLIEKIEGTSPKYKIIPLETVKQSLTQEKITVKQSLTPIKQSLTQNHEIVKQSLTNTIYKTIDNTISENLGSNNTKSKNKSKTKNDKYLEHIISILAEYDFSDKVYDLIIQYFSDKIQNKHYKGDNFVRSQFNELSKLNEKNQIESISKSILYGWSAMYYKPNEKNNKCFVDTAAGKDNWIPTEILKEQRRDKSNREYY